MNNSITHISYSSICLFLNNPAAWHSKYILGIKDQKTNPSAFVGVGFHKFLECIHKGMKKDTAVEMATATMDSMQSQVEFGKTGSLEKCKSTLDFLVQTFTELPKSHEIHKNIKSVVGVEALYKSKITGIKYPFVGYVDLVYEDVNDRIVIRDWKSVSSFEEILTPAQILQGCIYYWIVGSAHKKKPVAFEIVQFKTSKNSDGSPQTRLLRFPYAENAHYLSAMKDLIKATIREMNRKRKFQLINLRDSYEAESEFTRFVSQYAPLGQAVS